MIEKNITKKTKLIQLTHVGGEPVKDVEAIAKFAKKIGIDNFKIYFTEGFCI